jgi:hypothetical protein
VALLNQGTSTVRTPGTAGAVQAASTSDSGTARAVTARSPAASGTAASAPSAGSVARRVRSRPAAGLPERDRRRLAELAARVVERDSELEESA